MTARPDPRIFDVPAPQEKPVSFLRRLVRALAVILSSPRGDMGGWEAGARGL